MNKEDTINKLEQREARRRQSIVRTMISDPEPAAAQQKPAGEQKPPAASPLDFIKAQDRETRSKRVSTLLRPSVHLKAQKKCKRMGISLNDAINQFLERFIQEE